MMIPNSSTSTAPGTAPASSPAVPVYEDIRAFFEQLYPGVDDGYMVLSWPSETRTRPDGKPALDSSWHNLATTVWPTIVTKAATQAKTAHLFFGVVVQHPTSKPSPFKRSANAGAYIVPGLWFDLDLAYGQHAASTLPQTDTEALDFLASLPAAPSLIVHSGGGMYGWWLFKEPYVITSAAEHAEIAQLAERFTRTLCTLGKAHGWTLDALGDLARVLRPPGTINHKYGKLVELIHESGARYNPSDFDWLEPPRVPAMTTHGGTGIAGQPDLVTIAQHYGAVLEAKSSTELAGAHPQHGSSTGDNFNVNLDKGFWKCWRHGTGGDALSLIAVCEGMIDCAQAVSGALRGAVFKRVVEIANTTFQAGIVLTPRLTGTSVLNSFNSFNSLGAVEPNLPPEPVWPTCAPEAFYGLPGQIVSTIAPESESDPVAILGQLLVMIGNAIGRTPYFPVEATRHYPTLFLCLVGATSKGRKGTSAAYPKRLLKEIDPAHARRVTSGLSSGEGVIWNVRDPIYSTKKGKEEVCEDEGEPDKRLCIVESEFARALTKTAQDGNTLSAVLRQAWDGDDVLNTLVSGRTRAPVQATGAYVSVIAHITANELRRTLTDVEAANGFGNRFLWLCVRRSQLLPEGGDYPDTVLAPLRDQLAQAILGARQVARMTRSDAARSLWRDLYTAMAEGSPGLVGALTARAEPQVLRLSMLYALCENSAVIDVPHLQAAYALWQYCEASARYIFGESLGDPLADSILQMLRSAGDEGLTRTDISNELGRNVKSAAIGQVLALLRRERFIRSEVEKTSGRPSERFFACTLSSPPNELNELNEIRSRGVGPSPTSMGLNSFNSFNSSGHAQNTPPVQPPAFENFAPMALFCATCQQEQSVRTLHALDGSDVYSCATCDTTVGHKSSTPAFEEYDEA